MYSIDGFTWSTRRDELQVIKSRHEQELQNLAKVKDEVAKPADESEEGEAKEKAGGEEEEEASGPVRIDLNSDGEDDEEDEGGSEGKPTGAKGKRGRPKEAPAKKPAVKKAVPAKAAKAKKR